MLHVIAHMEKGGAERQLNLLVHASRHRHVIAVLAGNERPSVAEVECLPSLGLRDIYRRIRGMIGRHEVDIVQLWLPDRMTIPAMVAARAEGRIIISGDRCKARNSGPGALRDRSPYLCHLAAERIVPNYPHLLPRLSLRRALGFPKRTQVIFNGIETVPHVRPIAKVPDRLLFVGRLVRVKQVPLIVEALPALMQDHGITGLDVVGEGPESTRIEARAAALGIGAAVRLHGRLSDWGERFDPADHMLVLPSSTEGMSNTIFEAMAFGFLPFVSESPELDLILDGWDPRPVTIDHKDPARLVREVGAIRALPASEIEARVRGLQKQLDRFSVARMAAAYDSLYDELTGAGTVAARPARAA
ncbi:glycosyltransferase [Tropicimonas sp. IMCC6043]|uniref:glycosyltransferase n=1 Tax=Tropicimonas sp. IMCC6043 TaxID=2510645 RepID=UPI0013ED02FF|nr:glycosyltransferase [Tropicimonas sp. IMCC6043]